MKVYNKYILIKPEVKDAKNPFSNGYEMSSIGEVVGIGELVDIDLKLKDRINFRMFGAEYIKEEDWYVIDQEAVIRRL